MPYGFSPKFPDEGSVGFFYDFVLSEIAVWLPPKWILFISAGRNMVADVRLALAIFFMTWQFFENTYGLVEQEDAGDVGGEQYGEIGLDRKEIGEPSAP